jgi:hypothetical protein
MSDSQDDEPAKLEKKQLRTPKGRVYVHSRCGGQTRVSGGDFIHICDPFRPCTGTYCCQCAGFAPLNEVIWADTGEAVSHYRSRLRRETPWVIKIWRYGLGILVGGVIGAAIGLIVGLIAQVPQHQIMSYPITGGIAGALIIYLIGIFVLNGVFGIDYRRSR